MTHLFALFSEKRLRRYGPLFFAWMLVIAASWMLFMPAGVPTLDEVLLQTLELFTDPSKFDRLIRSFASSSKLMIISITFSCVWSMLVAYLWTVPLFRPFVDLYTYLRFAPLAALTFMAYKLTETQFGVSLALTVYGISSFLVTSMVEHIKGLSQQHIDYVSVLRLSRWKQFRELIVFGTLEKMMEALMQNAAIAFSMLVMAEGVARSGHGIGIWLFDVNRLHKYEEVSALLLIMFIMGISLQGVLVMVRRIVPVLLLMYGSTHVDITPAPDLEDDVADEDDPSYEYTTGHVLFSAKGVSHAYGETVVLRDVTLPIPDLIRIGRIEGQILGLVGPSGVGKTTLFRLASGLEPIQQGEITIGHPPIKASKGLVGMVMQHAPLLEHYTVLGNLLVVAQGLEKSAATEQAMRILHRLHIADQANHRISELSGGQRKRAALAQQLMVGSQVIFMDEPFVGIDPPTRRKVGEMIREASNLHEHGTIIVVSHDVRAVVEIADRVAIIGRDRDEAGALIPGARIQDTVDLIEEGIAWRPNNRELAKFDIVVRDIEERLERI